MRRYLRRRYKAINKIQAATRGFLARRHLGYLDDKDSDSDDDGFLTAAESEGSDIE